MVWNDLDGRREENGKPAGLTRQDDTTRLKELASEQGARRMGLEETGHTTRRLMKTSVIKLENIERKSAHPRRLNPPLENEPCVSELFPPSSACVWLHPSLGGCPSSLTAVWPIGQAAPPGGAF